MAEIVPEPIERYAEAHTTPPPPLLAELAEETRATLQSPQMLTGPIEGRFLQQLVFATGARRVLELGTYSGYSALSMAEGLPADGRIDTCEVDERHAEVARRYIARSAYADRITVHLGPALETIARLEGAFDLVFIDADKVNYVNYYEAVLPRLSERGLIVADNTLWSGRVLDPDDGEGTQAIVAFNEHVANDDRGRVRAAHRARRGHPDPPPLASSGMCRNIRVLYNFAPPATADEVEAAALQFVRKISGFTKPSQANAEAFDRAVAEVTAVSQRLLESLVTTAPPKDREVEAERRRERGRKRFAAA